MENAILVYVDLEGILLKVGRLWGHYRNGRESMSFEYDRDWLNHPKRFSLDPALKLVPGSFHASSGWRLSPAYDLNPTPTDIKPRILSTAIDLIDPSASVNLAADVAHYFDLSNPQAKKIIKEVGSATALWHKEAAKLKLKKSEIDRMASAFEHEDLRKTMQHI